MSYYAVDLFSAPAGGGETSGPPGPLSRLYSAPAPAVSKVVQGDQNPQSRGAGACRASRKRIFTADQDTQLRMLAKLKKKRLGLIKSEPQSPVESSSPQDNASDSGAAPQGELGHGSRRIGCSGFRRAGIVADAGPAFPVPMVFDSRLPIGWTKQWRPPQEYEPDTLCQK